MRARGAQGADIVILVVAADDGVMPQTKEAIAHAKAARVPIIVALNKIDKPNANPDRVKKQLGENDLIPDEWGGNTMVIPVSAKQKQGIEDLLEAILLVADNTDIRANPKGEVIGTVIEAELDKSKGPVATLLVQNGTLNTGDIVVAGNTYGRLRALFDFRGNKVQKAGPSIPVSVMGLERDALRRRCFQGGGNGEGSPASHPGTTRQPTRSRPPLPRRSPWRNCSPRSKLVRRKN